MMETNKHAIGYARVSTKRQSLELQIKAIESFASNNGYTIEVFSETASGKGFLHKWWPSILKRKRPALWQAISKAKQGNIPLIVLNLDRLSRSVKDGMWMYSELPQIISINEGEISEEMANAIFAHAELERKMCIQRTKSALSEARKRRTIKRQNKYSKHFKTGGSAEYVLEYVLGEIRNDRRTRSSILQEGDLLSCIMTAWGDVSPLDYSNPTIEESTLVAECALDCIAKKESRKNCSVEYPIDGWVFDEKIGYQVETGKCPLYEPKTKSNE